MKQFDPYDLPGSDQVWTDLDLAKFALIAFIAGLLIGYIL